MTLKDGYYISDTVGYFLVETTAITNSPETYGYTISALLTISEATDSCYYDYASALNTVALVTESGMLIITPDGTNAPIPTYTTDTTFAISTSVNT